MEGFVKGASECLLEVSIVCGCSEGDAVVPCKVEQFLKYLKVAWWPWRDIRLSGLREMSDVRSLVRSNSKERTTSRSKSLTDPAAVKPTKRSWWGSDSNERTGSYREAELRILGGSWQWGQRCTVYMRVASVQINYNAQINGILRHNFKVHYVLAVRALSICRYQDETVFRKKSTKRTVMEKMQKKRWVATGKKESRTWWKGILGPSPLVLGFSSSVVMVDVGAFFGL